MVTPNEAGKFWNRGTRLGLIYAVIAAIIFQMTTDHPPEGPLVWLKKFSYLVFMIPFAAASHAYFAGVRDTINQSNGSR